MSDNFKLFLENEEEKDVKNLISKLPKSHQKLLNGFKFTFTPGNTLKGDNSHIGYIHKDKIVVAAPWHISRSMTTAHEIGHLVYEHLMDKKLRNKWSKLLKKTMQKHKETQLKTVRSALDQNDEEIFCNVYGNFYSKHKIKTYDHPEWMNFIKNLK